MLLECFCIGGSTEWNWEAIGAIGQWTGALATAVAVWWGVRQTNLALRSKAKLEIDILTHKEGDILRAIAINKGHSLIRFSNVYIMHIHTKKYILGYVFYKEHEREPTEPNDRKTHGFSLDEFASECTKNGWKNTHLFKLEFHDSAGNTFIKKFKFDFNTNSLVE